MAKHRINSCPLCGGKIIVSYPYISSIEYPVLLSGKVGQRGKKLFGNCGDSCCMAYCSNERCNAVWEFDDFDIVDGYFVDKKYTKKDEK